MTPADFDPATIAALALRLDTPDKLEANGALHGAAAIGANAMLRAIGDALRVSVVEVEATAHLPNRLRYALPPLLALLRSIIAVAPDSRAEALRAFSARANAAGLSLVALVDEDDAATSDGDVPTSAPPIRSDPCAVRMHAWDALSWTEQKAAVRRWPKIAALVDCIDCPPGGCGAKAGSACKSAEGGGNG